MPQQIKAAESENLLAGSESQASLGLTGYLLTGVEGITALNMSSLFCVLLLQPYYVL